MLSALIPSAHSYPALPLVGKPVHQRCVQPGPLVTFCFAKSQTHADSTQTYAEKFRVCPCPVRDCPRCYAYPLITKGVDYIFTHPPISRLGYRHIIKVYKTFIRPDITSNQVVTGSNLKFLANLFLFSFSLLHNCYFE